MASNRAWLIIGKIVAPQGLRGEIRVQPLSDFPERFTQPGKRWLKMNETNAPLEIELVSGRKLPGKEIYILRLKYETRSLIEAANCKIVYDLPPPTH